MKQCSCSRHYAEPSTDHFRKNFPSGCPPKSKIRDWLKALILAVFLVPAPSTVAESVVSGSGFFVSNDGFFATAHHVVKDASEIQLVLPDGSLVGARIVGYDRANDLAVLKAEGRFPFLPIGNSGVVRRGTGVMTVGYPNAAIQGREPKVTRGIVNSLTGIENDPRVFQVDLPIQTGNSGGPLVLDSGDVIGVVVSKLSDLFMLKSSGSLPQNVNYAVKANYLRELIATIPLLNQSPLPSNHMRPTDFADLTALVERSTALIVARSQKVPDSLETSRSEKDGKEPIISRRLPDTLKAIGGVEFTDENWMMRELIIEATNSALRAVDAPRYFRTERGFHGRFYCLFACPIP